MLNQVSNLALLADLKRQAFKKRSVQSLKDGGMG
jgi:hypothetical protein